MGDRVDLIPVFPGLKYKPVLAGIVYAFLFYGECTKKKWLLLCQCP
jgi:hypothetical protein